MAVKVEFPDGTIRKVESRKVRLKSDEVVQSAGDFIEEPVPDPKWQFHPLAHGHWIATERGS